MYVWSKSRSLWHWGVSDLLTFWTLGWTSTFSSSFTGMGTSTKLEYVGLTILTPLYLYNRKSTEKISYGSITIKNITFFPHRHKLNPIKYFVICKRLTVIISLIWAWKTLLNLISSMVSCARFCQYRQTFWQHLKACSSNRPDGRHTCAVKCLQGQFAVCRQLCSIQGWKGFFSFGFCYW